MSLLFNLVGSLIIILGVIVTALTVPDSIAKRMSIGAALVLGLVWLILTIVIFEQTPGNPPYFSNAIVGAANLASNMARSHTFQIFLALAFGLTFGWHLKSLRYKRQSLSAPTAPDWKASDNVLELIGEEALNARREHVSKMAGLNAEIVGFNKKIQAGTSVAKYIAKKAKYEKWKQIALSEEVILYRQQIVELHSLLEKGDLIAQGFLLPVAHDAKPITILKEQWRFLKLSEDFAQAKGESITYVGIVIARTAS
jgi:hypothetical protein